MLITLKEVASALHRLRLQPGQNVVVAGCGPVGIAMAALAKCMGAGKVVLAGHHPARIAAAKRLGADRWRTLCAARCRRVWICISMRSATRIF